MFEIKLKKSKADIYYKSDLQTSKNAWCNISISKNSIFVYISRDKSRSYWICGKKGKSCKLSIKFNDSKKMITVNTANKIIIHSDLYYTNIKKKAIYYKYMNENDNRIEFKEI
jgi:hypothetical protein